MKTLYKDKQLNSEEIGLYNKRTGETFDLENAQLITRVQTGEMRYNSKSYVYLDTERLSCLKAKGIKYNELGVALLLAENLLFKYNICMSEDGNPHNTNSISKVLGISPQATKKILNRLVFLNALNYDKIFGPNKFGKVYIMNPYLIRRGKDFSNSIGALFSDILPQKLLKPNIKELEE